MELNTGVNFSLGYEHMWLLEPDMVAPATAREGEERHDPSSDTALFLSSLSVLTHCWIDWANVYIFSIAIMDRQGNI